MSHRFSPPVENLASLATALGLDPETLPIRSIKIEASVYGVEVAVVELIVDDDGHKQLTEVFKRFTLTPKEADG